MIDCILVGHNEIDLAKQKKILRLNSGENSPGYRERTRFNLAQIKFKNQQYSAQEFFNTFISPDPNQTLTTFGEAFSLAVAYLGTYLCRRGFSFDYINSFNREKEELAQMLQEKKVMTVALITTYYVIPYPLIEIVNFIRKYNKAVQIIIGGPYIINQTRSLEPTALEKLFLSIDADIYINSAEGEATLAKTLTTLKNQQSLQSVENIYYKENDHYTATNVNVEQNQMDENYVDWGLFRNKLTRNVNIRTSLSCPFACSFCVFPKHAGKYRQMSLEAFERELDTLRDTGVVSGINIIDDTANFPMKRFKAILRMMIKNKYHFKWNSFFRCQYVDREMVELMKESGCEVVFCGIESGSQTILDNMNKCVKVEEYFEGMELLNEFEIMSVASVIVGFPGETYETFNETVNFIETTKPTFFQERLWACDQKSSIYQQRDKFQLEGSDYDWSHNTMDSKQAVNLAEEMFLSIKNSIHITEYPLVFDLINRGYSPKQVKQYFTCYNSYLKDTYIHHGNNGVRDEQFESLKNALL